MIFKDANNLKNYLKEDASKTSLNPVRFINVDSLAMWAEMKSFLWSLSDEQMCLSKYCEGSDTIPNIKRLKSSLKKTTKSQFITPLSEYLRVMPEEAEAIIVNIIKDNYSNNAEGRLRLYFLMYRMKDLLKSLPSDDPREKDCRLFLETSEETEYRLTIIQKELAVHISGNAVDGFRNYLEYWESNPSEPLVLYTNNAIHFEKNHFFDDVRVIVSSYDLIKCEYGLPNNVNEDLGTPENWNALVKVIAQEGSFDDACCSTLSINKYNIKLFDNWNTYDDQEKWLLWLWTRLQLENSYLIECSKVCESDKEFVDELYCRIRYHLDNDYEQVYRERKDILCAMKTVPTEHFWDEINKLDHYKALLCLTNLTDIERKTIFRIISEIDYDNRQNYVNLLENVYPQLFEYLSDDAIPYGVLSQQLEQYFSEYKWLKATDTVTQKFISEVNQIAEEKGTSVFELRPRDYYVSKYYDNHTAILFVDGMGVEYVNYLTCLFSDLDPNVYSYTIDVGYCTLPSITEINKDFMIDRNAIDPPIRELDSLKHANNSYPESLVKQLNILADIKDKVLGLMTGDITKIIIVSDHGTSRLAVKVRNTEFDNIYPKPDNVEKIYKYGRFCEGTLDESNYPTAIYYNDKLIFADYSRFVQKGAPIDEIHGGASLEEWLVPVITIERHVKEKTIHVVVMPEETKYKPQLGTNKVKVQFKITGDKRESVKAKIQNITYDCVYKEGIYSFEFVPAKKDTKLNVKIFDIEFLGEFDIFIEQGIKNNPKFDI